ncbi:MAG: TetR/AcrR family transcriptional regulator [Gammaproteobacteria bacterium]|nr:TetR/AcrR family transcriptional regulator [Gammaproteobacteria bacterium]MCP5198479.1 TetR/AcrR family transcriptional regulator [Gammaproteobacteria bacterium]
MPHKPRQRLSQAERRAQLLRGAIAEAANVGLGRLTHAGVARECGVSVPTVFSYFENRTALVKSTVEEVKRVYLELAAYWHRPEIPPLAALEGHVKAYSESIKDEPQYAQVWLEWCTAVRNEDGIWDSFLDYHNRIVEMMASSIRRGQKQGDIARSTNATDAARLILSSGITITQLHFMWRDKREINRFIRQTLYMALHQDLPGGAGSKR